MKLTAGALARAIHNASLCTQYMPELPVLGMVYLRFDGTTLTVAGTDRYTLLVHRLPCDTPDGGQFLLQHRDIPLLLTFLADGADSEPREEVDEFGHTIEVDADPLRSLSTVEIGYTASGATFTIGDRQLNLPRGEAEFPKFDGLLDRLPTTPGASAPAFNPQFIARVAEIRHQSQIISRPWKITVGGDSLKPGVWRLCDTDEDITFVIMPVKQKP